MKLDGVPSRTIWLERDGWSVGILDQTLLPHKIERVTLRDGRGCGARDQVDAGARRAADRRHGGLWRGAGDASRRFRCGARSCREISRRAKADRRQSALGARRHARERSRRLAVNARAAAAYARAGAIAEDDVETCRRIGLNGLELIKDFAEKKDGRPVNILTHCNAGWLACVDWGTATSPIYQAHDAGIPVHVWVDETRPRNQGAALTAFELLQHGVPHSLIADNAGGHFMQRDDVDLVIVGTDRVTAGGDVANKIGTYLKALAAHDNGVPFYVALPYSTIDWSIEKGADIPIEERGADEVLNVQGRLPNGDVASVAISAEGTQARNPAFDVTPARLVTGLITERGVCAASRARASVALS